MRRRPLPVACTFDDELVAGVGQPVKGAVGQYGIIEETLPFSDASVTGDVEAGAPVPGDGKR